MTDRTTTPLSASRGRFYIVLASLLWSLSGGLTKLLTQPTGYGLDEPKIPTSQIACLRTLLAGLVLSLILRRGDVSFRPLMVIMAVCFGAMNLLFVSAMSAGPAADAILLQYTAPMWMFLACVWFLGEPTDRRSLNSVAIGMAGVGVIIAGGWRDARLPVIFMGLGSGFLYACVMICLRVMRTSSSSWMTVVNHLAGGLMLLPFVLPFSPAPTPAQWVVLFFFGVIQLGIPYLLMARGLQSVSPQEAGAITLIEPLLNPFWAYLVAGEIPSPWTFAGGAFILGALAYRYGYRKS